MCPVGGLVNIQKIQASFYKCYAVRYLPTRQQLFTRWCGVLLIQSYRFLLKAQTFYLARYGSSHTCKHDGVSLVTEQILGIYMKCTLSAAKRIELSPEKQGEKNIVYHLYQIECSLAVHKGKPPRRGFKLFPILPLMRSSIFCYVLGISKAGNKWKSLLKSVILVII